MNIFHGYTKLDENIDAYTSFDGASEYMINCFLVPAFLSDEKRFSTKNTLRLQWQKDVLELNLYDVLFDFGFKGDMLVIDNYNSLSYILEQFVSYELVINITQKVTNTSPPLKFEPYICSIVKIEPITTPGTTDKKLRIYFEDLLSATAKRATIGTFLKINPDFKETGSFVEAFKTIIDYLQNIINRNNNGAYEYEKKFKFDTTDGADEKTIIEPIVDSFDQDASLYQLLQALCDDSCEIIKPSPALLSQFETIGDVLIPMFCREEYTDAQNFYYTKYNIESDKMTDVSSKFFYLHRPFTFRNFYMPFEQGFMSDESVIFESFTITNDSKELKQKTINGISTLPIAGFESVSANMDSTARRWKNLAFISSGANGGSNRLVYFHWFYEFFNRCFLNSKLNDPTTKVSNILPAFHAAELENPDLLYDQDLAERNSNVILIRNEKADPIKEILMQIGKSIASLVVLNNSYSFESQGSLLRRPNEIINLYMPNENNEISPNPIRTDLAMSKNVMLYSTAILHSFKGNTFRDKIICNRIYEKTR